MAPLSGAERAKRFRKRNKALVLVEDGLRKRRMRTTCIMKFLDRVKNQMRLAQQRLYKQEYRRKTKATMLPASNTGSYTEAQLSSFS